MQPKHPDFLIVGSAKCGTTALASILANHPECCMSRPKEVSFFQDNIDFKPNPNFEKGWDWYQKAFSHYQGELIVGEATPSYSDRSRSPNTAKRIFDFNPRMKIVYMVRDPLARQISSWKMHYAMGNAKLHLNRREDQWALKGFDYWLNQQYDAGQWDECRYSYQLEAYQSYFPDSQISVSFLEDWKLRQDKVVAECCEFLNLKQDASGGPGDIDWNRGNNRKFERPLLKKLRSIPLVRKAAQFAPSRLRDFASHLMVFKNADNVSCDLNSESSRRFVEYVQQDCLSFLKRFSRTETTWPSLDLRLQTTKRCHGIQTKQAV